MVDAIVNLLLYLETACSSHISVSRSCSDFNDLDGELYHSGMSAAYSQVADYVRSLLSELDPESGR